MDLRLIIGTGYTLLIFNDNPPQALDPLFVNSIPIYATVNVKLTDLAGVLLEFQIVVDADEITGINPNLPDIIVTQTTVTVPNAFPEVLYPLCAGSACILQPPFSPSQFRQ
jgi:hypothetical protein